jgi:hypothetical protein
MQYMDIETLTGTDFDGYIATNLDPSIAITETVMNYYYTQINRVLADYGFSFDGVDFTGPELPGRYITEKAIGSDPRVSGAASLLRVILNQVVTGEDKGL